MGKRKKAEEKTEFPYGYICSQCAALKGLRWPECHAATAHRDICHYCGFEGSLTALTDWLFPGEEKLKNWD